MYNVADLLIVQCFINGLLSADMAVVGCCCVACIDGEELPLNVRFQIVDPVDCMDLGMPDVRKRGLLHHPLVEGFDFDVQASIGVLPRHNTVNGRVGEAGTLVDGSQTVLGSILRILDKARKGIGSVDGIFASDDRNGLGLFAGVYALGNNRSDELENIRTHSAGHLAYVLVSHFPGERSLCERTMSAVAISETTSASLYLELIAR